jgi:hypothetical protein
VEVPRGARTLTPRPAPSQHQATVTSIAFAPNGRNAVTGDTQGRIVTWDLATMTPLPTQGADGAFGFVWGLSYSSDSALLAAGGGGGAIRAWDVRDPSRVNRVRGRLEGHREGVLRLAFSPDPASKMLVSGSFENRGLMWDLSRPAVARALGDGPAALGGGLNSAGGVVAFLIAAAPRFGTLAARLARCQLCRRASWRPSAPRVLRQSRARWAWVLRTARPPLSAQGGSGRFWRRRASARRLTRWRCRVMGR